MNARLSFLLILLLVFLVNASCDDGESIPDFTGHWEYEQASPPEGIDSCYFGSYMWIYESNDFTIFNACDSTETNGRWSSQGFIISVRFPEEGFGNFQAKIVTLTDNVLVLESTMFGQLLKVRFIRANQADQRDHSDKTYANNE